MSQPLRIFISSTWVDLRPEREAVEKALHRMQSTTFAGMEYFGSRPATPKETSLAEVSRCDVYVGIFAYRYGSGITEAEYRRAREQDLPCLIYLKGDSPAQPGDLDQELEKRTRLKQLKEELKRNHTVSFFASPEQLATQVVTDLHGLLTRDPALHNVRKEEVMPKYQIHITNAQGITIGDNAQVTQYFSASGEPQTGPMATISETRLQQLQDNIQQDLELLKDFEDALRYEDDPRRLARYRRAIAELKTSAANYKEEIAALLNAPHQPEKSSSSPSDVSEQLRRLDEKLDTILRGQAGTHQQIAALRTVILERLDEHERTIVSHVIVHLDESQLLVVENVLAALERQSIPQTDETGLALLTAVQQTLAEWQQQPGALNTQARQEIQQIAELVAEPRLDVRHRLKVSVPIIPLMLAYEGEVALNSSLNLEAAWQRFISRLRGSRE